MENNECISISSLNKTVQTPAGSLDILCDINLNVKKHEAIVISGASGSGKTSLLSIMAGLDKGDSGKIALFGQDMVKATEEQRARIRSGRVGFVFQNFQLVRGASAAENVQLPMELLGVEDARERAMQALEKVGLENKAPTLVDYLSGGEQQRVSIARAFAIEPDVLFADEPTGNLDSKNGQQIADLMFDLRTQHGTALVLVTHEASFAERGDRQVKMQAGRIISDA